MQIPHRHRVSFLYAEHGYLEVDGHAVVLRQEDTLTHFPVGGASAVLLMPGTVVTHAAVKACAEEDCLLIWVGENGVRCYSAGNPGRSADNLLRQASLFLSPRSRLDVARRIFFEMFHEEAPERRDVDQLRGIEGGKVKALYAQIAKREGVEWQGRNNQNALSDPLNLAISCANAALYGLVEAVIVALGYSPAIGFVHRSDPRSFVFDVADCCKFETVVPLSMRIAKESHDDIEGRTRRACRDLFGAEKMPDRLVGIAERLLGE